MSLSQAQIGQLHEAVKEFTNERTMIMASPGMIRNNGRLVDTVMVVIGHNPTQKKYEYIYRGMTHNFKDWLKKKIDLIENR
jgi:hypothetical protein